MPEREATDFKENTRTKTSRLNTSKRVSQDIRKSKIFDNTNYSDRYLRPQETSSSRTRTVRTANSKKKIFNSSINSSKTPLRKNTNRSEMSSPEENAESRREERMEVYQGIPNSEDEMSSSSKEQNSRSRSKTQRSKIFNLKQPRAEETSPRFVYSRVDTLPESERRKRIGIDDHL